MRQSIKIPLKARNRRFTVIEASGESHKNCAIASLYRDNDRLCVRFAAWNGSIIPTRFFGDEVTDWFSDGSSVGLSWKQKRRKVRSDRHITEEILSGFLFGEM